MTAQLGINSEKTVRLAVAHEETASVEYHEWVCFGAFFKGDANGELHSKMHNIWIKVVCNNPDCPAWAVVNPTRLVEMLHPTPPKDRP